MLTERSRAAKISFPHVPQMGYTFSTKFWLKLRFVPGRRLPLHARDRSGIWSYRMTRHLLRWQGASGALWCQVLRLGAARDGCVCRSPPLTWPDSPIGIGQTIPNPPLARSPGRASVAGTWVRDVVPTACRFAAHRWLGGCRGGDFPEEKRCRERSRRFRAHPRVVA